ncbi:MAG: peptidoglycan-binding domain-containing protein [Paracoccaceae bacterium]
MIAKRIATGCLAASLVIGPVERATAGGNDIVGGIVGGIIGGVIVNEANRKRSKKVYRRATVSSATREANREVQVALNYFGYPAGTPDGALGRRSQAAISQYQAQLGYPPTGQLTEYERMILTTAYHRAVAGGPTTAQTIATHPLGVRGLLIAQRDEMAGVPSTPTVAPAPSVPVLAVPAPTTEQPTLPVLAPEVPAEPEMAGTGGATLPSFMGGDTTQASLASHCNKISLLTNTNGGFTTVANMTDPTFALGEQFCLARTYAIAAGEEAASAVQGFTPAQIAEQCKAFGPAMHDQVNALSLQARDDVLKSTGGFILASGMSPAQLSATARICLSVGYRTDDMGVAIGSALLLTALGEKGYAELLGHHLSQGFGAGTRPELAIEWYEMGVDATAMGATPVFAPGQPERTELIRRAAYTLGGRAGELEPLAPTDPVPASLPSFAAIEPVAEPETAVAPLPEATVEAAAAEAPAKRPITPFGALVTATMAPFALLQN